MLPFTKLISRLIPMPVNNIDTDKIIPARYLKVIDKNGLADGLFYSWRYHPDGSPNRDFCLNQPAYRDCTILVVGDNFGCGSSREHAPWAITGWGIRAVISTSFADIFRNNALKNGLLPVIVDGAFLQKLFALADRASQQQSKRSLSASDSEFSVSIDLSNQKLSLPTGVTTDFPIGSFEKTCLLNGIDSLGYLLNLGNEIDLYEKNNQTGQVRISQL
jgi:3-isopropylmalate/(R)-2-methylmalate dehydratase small subunit